MIKNVDGNNLGTVWEKVAELVKKLTGDVELPKGNLQEQILNHTHDNRYYTENEIDEKLGEKLLKTGDSKDLTTTFTSQDSTNVTQWTDVGVLQSGEKHSSMFQKISTMFKNIRYLYHMLGTADISTLGEGADIGTVTGALSKLNSDYNKSSNLYYYTFLKEVNFELVPGQTYLNMIISDIPSSTKEVIVNVTSTGNVGYDIKLLKNCSTKLTDFRGLIELTSYLTNDSITLGYAYNNDGLGQARTVKLGIWCLL